MANWKATAPDGVRELWFKNIKSLHGVIIVGDYFGEVETNREMFQRDFLSLLLFVVAMIPLNTLINSGKIGFKFGKYQGIANRLLFVDNSNLLGKSWEGLESLTDIVFNFSRDVGKEFGWISIPYPKLWTSHAIPFFSKL